MDSGLIRPAVEVAYTGNPRWNSLRGAVLAAGSYASNGLAVRCGRSGLILDEITRRVASFTCTGISLTLPWRGG